MAHRDKREDKEEEQEMDNDDKDHELSNTSDQVALQEKNKQVKSRESTVDNETEDEMMNEESADENEDVMNDSMEFEDQMNQGDTDEANSSSVAVSSITGKPKPKHMWSKKFQNWYNIHHETLEKKYNGKECRAKARSNDFPALSNIEQRYWSWYSEEEFYPNLPKYKDIIAAAETAPKTDCYCSSPFCELPKLESLPELPESEKKTHRRSRAKSEPEKERRGRMRRASTAAAKQEVFDEKLDKKYAAVTAKDIDNKMKEDIDMMEQGDNNEEDVEAALAAADDAADEHAGSSAVQDDGAKSVIKADSMEGIDQSGSMDKGDTEDDVERAMRERCFNVWFAIHSDTFAKTWKKSKLGTEARSSRARKRIFNTLPKNEIAFWRWHTKNQFDQDHQKTAKLHAVEGSASESKCACPSPCCKLPPIKSSIVYVKKEVQPAAVEVPAAIVDVIEAGEASIANASSPAAMSNADTDDIVQYGHNEVSLNEKNEEKEHAYHEVAAHVADPAAAAAAAENAVNDAAAAESSVAMGSDAAAREGNASISAGKKKPTDMRETCFNNWIEAHAATFSRLYPRMMVDYYGRSSKARTSHYNNLHENELAWWRWHSEQELDSSVPMSDALLAAVATEPKKECSCPSPFCALPALESIPELKDAENRQKKSIWLDPFNVWYYAHVATLTEMHPRFTGLVRRETVGEIEFLNLKDNESAFWRDFTDREFNSSLPPSAALIEAAAIAPKSECSCISPFCALPSIESVRERSEKEQAKNGEDRDSREHSVEM